MSERIEKKSVRRLLCLVLPPRPLTFSERIFIKGQEGGEVTL